MTTRFGRHVHQDLANFSGQEVSGLKIGRLANKYAKAVEEQKLREAANASEFKMNIPHVKQLQRQIAASLEEQAAEINGKLPVAAVYDALQIVKARKDGDTDAGLRAFRGQLEKMWKRDRGANITASSYLMLHEHYAKNFPKSAVRDVITEIGEKGYATLPVSDLQHIASTIRSQDDYDMAMVKYGLSGPQPHQVKARNYVLAMVNGEEADDDYGMETADWVVDKMKHEIDGGDSDEYREKHPAPQRKERKENSRPFSAGSKVAVHIPTEEVEFDIRIQPEYDAPEDQFTEDDQIQWVRDQMEMGNEWGWCSVEVRASWTDQESGRTFTGSDYLGGCSYESEEDFKVGGYYEQMQEEAYDELLLNAEDSDTGMKGLRPQGEAPPRENSRPFSAGSRRAQMDKGENALLSSGLHSGNYDSAYVGGDWEENLDAKYEEGSEEVGDPAYEAAYIIGFVSGSSDNWMWDDDYMDAWNKYGEKLQAMGLVADNPYEEQGDEGGMGDNDVTGTRQAQAGSSDFVAAYIEAALWSSSDQSDDQGGAPLEDNYDTSDIDPEAMQQIIEDCQRFQQENEADLEEYYELIATNPEWNSEEYAGHDFWLTRNGHGAGFWDREVGDVGDRLSEAAEAFGEVDLYVGDDGRLYV